MGRGVRMKIDCLMGTYGRYALACEALACFLQQSAIGQATLLIYNQHPIQLRFDHPRVRVVNEPPPPGSLRHIRRRMLELSDPAADLIHWWDDDDLYLPWHLADCLEHVGASVAWRPRSCWMLRDASTYRHDVNTFEGAWIFRADYLKTAPLDTHPTYTDHPVVPQTIEAGRLTTTELGGRTSYIYRWATGAQHVSGFGREGNEQVQRDHIEWWRRRSRDVRTDGMMVPADLRPRWRHYLDGTRHLVTSAEWELNRRSCG